jgi:hypothetical protein
LINFLKWIATAVLIAGTAVNGLGYYPAGPIILTVGGVIWLAVAILWREPALIVTNVVMTLTGVGTLVYKLYF